MHWLSYNSEVKWVVHSCVVLIVSKIIVYPGNVKLIVHPTRIVGNKCWSFLKIIYTGNVGSNKE